MKKNKNGRVYSTKNKKTSTTKRSATTTRSVGVYYEIKSSTSTKWGISSDRRENFVYVSDTGVWDSREIDYWIDVRQLNGELSTIEDYCNIYEVNAVPVSSKTLLLLGMDLCYADVFSQKVKKELDK